MSAYRAYADRSGRYGGGTGVSSYRPSGSSVSSYKPTGSSYTPSLRASSVSALRDKYSLTPSKNDAIRSRSSPEPTQDSSKARRYGTPVSSRDYQPPETPTLRFGSSSRFGGQIARSPITEKSPTVFGVSTPTDRHSKERGGDTAAELNKMLISSRSTSPTPPSNSTFLRNRRADMERVTTVEMRKLAKRNADADIQTDNKGTSSTNQSTARTSATPWTSRFAGGTNSSGISSKYTPHSNGCGYTRSTDMPVRPNSLDIAQPGREAEPAAETTSEENKLKGKIEGKDTARIGGFSYARPTDLPLRSPLKTPDKLENELKAKLSPQHENAPMPVVTQPHVKPNSASNKSPSVTVEYPSGNLPLLSSKSSVKLAPQDRCKLPPTVPKSESSAKIVNKDFRKSTLNMDLSISNESQEANKSLAKPSTDNDKKLTTIKTNKLQTSKSLSKIKSVQIGNHVPKINITKAASKSIVLSGNQLISESSSEETSSSHSCSSSSEVSEDECEQLGSKGKHSTAGTTDTRFLSTTSSRTSMPMSSADEASISTDKPPKPPTSPRAKTNYESIRTEDAKAVLVRALTPVAGVMRVRYPAGSGADAGAETKVKPMEMSSKDSSSHEAKNNHDPCNKAYRIRKIESGEKAWWLNDNDNKVQRVPSGHSDESRKGCNLAECKGSILQNSKSCLIVPEVGPQRPESPNRYRISRIESGERAWWMVDSSGLEKSKSSKTLDPTIRGLPSGEKDQSGGDPLPTDADPPRSMLSPVSANFKLRRFDSGEVDWWNDSDDSRNQRRQKPRSKGGSVFIGQFMNVDHLLGSEAPPPAAFTTPANTSSEDSCAEDDNVREVYADQVRIHDSTAQNPTILRGMIKLDDTALQLYKDGDYGAYLDLEASINEQQEEFEAFQTNRKNSIVLRTQLSVRVHTIIEKLLNSEGRELRRALFSLKQIFQEDKDLVHEFVQNNGLSCLIKVGSDADQNYQNYILRALGQVMLYVDGMNGVIDHPATVQWLYCLVSSKFRLVVKTALKLLLVFVEYAETNCVLLVKAIKAVDYVHGCPAWSNLMRLLKEYDAADTELLIYATSLINKTLNGLPDQDTYYDQVDALEEQGFEAIIRRYMSKQGTDLDLLRQFQIYEAVLHHEDGEQKGTPLRQLDETIRKALRNRKSLTTTLNPIERRKSRRHSTGTSPLPLTLNLMRCDLQQPIEQLGSAVLNGLIECNGSDSPMYNKDAGSPLRRESTVKDLTQKLATTLHSPVDDGTKSSPFSDMKGIISKAKEGLIKSQSRGDLLKSPSGEVCPAPRPPEIKKSETELQWEELLNSTTRALRLCDLDFTDLATDDERDVLAPSCIVNGVPPPPPPCGAPPPAPALSTGGGRLLSPARKTKKTVKLFWKEVRDDPIVIVKMNSGSLIWDELAPVTIDTQKLEHLFESRAKDLITKKQQELNKNKEIIVLDHKRSNAINIGMTKLPPPGCIKTAILKMDATVMNREGIEKLLTMLPSEEERSKIQEAQAANPDLPLGSAEQFLLTLASISELSARLKLWAFKLDYENSEKEIAEPLMDLKQGMETLRVNVTFRAILGTLLSIGIFLNGNKVKGFQIEYLAKVPEVKDTVHKHSLLHHLCHMVMEKFPDASDLYSEIGAVTRASKIDFEELSGNILKMEQECKASFDHLKVIAKHDGSSVMKVKISDFLADCAERIIVLSKVHRRVLNRYHKFCLWLGIPLHRVGSTKPNELCRVVSEFALEYRTTRERVLQQLEKKASHRERNKTRGKMITEVGKFRSQEDRKDAELRKLLGSEADSREILQHGGSLPWRRQRKDATGRTVLGPLIRDEGLNGNLTDADDEILETLVKTATKAPGTRAPPRERKRTRNADRKSLIKRSRTRDSVPGGGNVSGSA